jgi:hypothetical protein
MDKIMRLAKRASVIGCTPRECGVNAGRHELAGLGSLAVLCTLRNLTIETWSRIHHGALLAARALFVNSNRRR